MSVNLHHSSNINLDWSISASPAAPLSEARRGLRFPPHDPSVAAATADAAHGGYAGAPTPLRQNMLTYLAHVHDLSPPAGAVSAPRQLPAGPRGGWAAVAPQQDVDMVSHLRAPTGRGIRAWDCNDLSKTLTKWGHNGPRKTSAQEAFCPPAYAIIRGGGQVARDMSGVDLSPYAQGLERRPVASGEGPRRHLQSQVDVQEDKSLLRLPDSRDNERFKGAINPRFNAAELPEAGARLSSFDGEGGREGTIVDYQGKLHHPDVDSRRVRRKQAVDAPGVRMYEPNVATVKVRDWGHAPVTTTVTNDAFFSERALQYRTDEDARRPQAGAAFDSRTKGSVRDPPMYNTFSGEGPRRHLRSNFSTKEDPQLTIPRRGDHELYKAAPGKVDATRLPEAGAHHTALDDKDLTIFPLNKQRLAQPRENPGVRLLDQTPGTDIGAWQHPRVRSTQAMDDFQAPPLPPPPGTRGDQPGAGLGGKVGLEAPGTRSGLDPRRHLATQFSTKVDGMAGGVGEGGPVKLEMRRDITPRDIPMAGTAATSMQGIAGDLPATASRDVPAPAVAIGAAGKVHDKPRQVGPRANAVIDQTLSNVVIAHEFTEVTPPPPPAKRSQRRLAEGGIAAKVYKTHCFEPVEPTQHTFKYRRAPPPPPPRGGGVRPSGDPRDREWRSEHTPMAGSGGAEGEPVVPPWGDDEYHIAPDASRSRHTDTFRQTHHLPDQEAHLRPDSPPQQGLVGGLEPTNPYAAASTRQAVEKPVRVRVTDSVRTTLPKRWDGEETHAPDTPFGRSATTGAEVGADADEEDIVRLDPVRSAAVLSFGAGTTIPGIGKRPDGTNALTADYTSRDLLARFERPGPRGVPPAPKVTNTMRVSRLLDNPVDTQPDHDGPARAAPTTAQEIDFHGRDQPLGRVNSGTHLARGSAAFGTRPDGDGFTADVQTTDFYRYVPNGEGLGPGEAPYETKKTDFTTTAQDIAPRSPTGATTQSPHRSPRRSPRARKGPSPKELLARLAAKLSVGGGGVSGSHPADPAAGAFVAEGPSDTLPAHSPTARSRGGLSSTWMATHGNPDAPPEEPSILHRDQSEARTWTTTSGEVGSCQTAGAAWTGGGAAAEGENIKARGLKAKQQTVPTDDGFVAGANPEPYVLPSMRREYDAQERAREQEEQEHHARLSPRSSPRGRAGRSAQDAPTRPSSADTGTGSNEGHLRSTSPAQPVRLAGHPRASTTGRGSSDGVRTRPSSPEEKGSPMSPPPRQQHHRQHHHQQQHLHQQQARPKDQPAKREAPPPPAGGGPLATVVTTPPVANAAPGRWVHLKFIQKALAVARGKADSL